MKVHQVISCLELLAPLAYSEDFDNTGLLVGSTKAEVSGILVAHDMLEEVVDEAIELGCNMVVGFHPIIFSHDGRHIIFMIETNGMADFV